MQLEVPSLCLHKQGLSVSVSGTFLQSKHCSPGVYLPGPHCVGLPPLSRHISASLPQQLVSSLPGPSGTARPLDRATTIAQSGWLQTKCLQVTAETSCQDIQFLSVQLPL